MILPGLVGYIVGFGVVLVLCALSVLVALLILGAIYQTDKRAMQIERAAALCLPAPGEISHTSYEPDGSLRCAVMRRGQLVTRLEIQP